MSYSRRWKPNASQRAAYAEKMREAEEMFSFIESQFPIREGCQVKWADKSTNEVFEGEVVSSSYGAKTGQHTFTVLLSNGGKKRVKGRNLYDRLLFHAAGEVSRGAYDGR